MEKRVGGVLMYFVHHEWRPHCPWIYPEKRKYSHTNTTTVDCVWNVMAHAQKPVFAFPPNGRVHLNRRGDVSSVDYWQASCTRQSAGFVPLVRACVLQSCNAYWLPTPFSCFPFTSPVCHRVPLHFKRSIPWSLWHRDSFCHAGNDRTEQIWYLP